MFVTTAIRPTAHFGSDEEAAIQQEFGQAQNDIRMETKSIDDEYMQSSEDSPEFTLAERTERKQSYAGVKRNQIYKESSFVE